MRATRVARSLSLVILLANCGGGATANDILILAKLAGDIQQGIVGFTLTTRPSVKVTQNSQGVSGVAVTFAVASGGGSVTGGTVTTGSDGVATVGNWTLGTTAGTNTLTASAANVTGSPVTFTATAGAGDVAAITKEPGGDNQAAVAGAAVAVRPAVKLVDQYGNVVPSAGVTFAVASGGGSATGAGATTAGSGIATVGSWLLGTTAGQNTLTATVIGVGITGNPATFTATGNPGPAASITKTAGDNQTAPVSTVLPNVPTVRVRDINQNLVPGVQVTFAVASGGGTATNTVMTTGVNGVGVVGSWTLGPVAGANTMTATAAGAGITGNPATFTATGTAVAPANMVAFEGDAQVAISGTAVPIDPAVRVTAADGSPVAGVQVDFTVTAGNGAVAIGPLGVASSGPSLANVVVGTDANGVARVSTWILGGPVGANSLRARITGSGIPDVTFTATGAFNPAIFTGTWIGTNPVQAWRNITFSSFGAGTLTIAVNVAAQTASMTLDLEGNVFGQGNPPAEVLNGSYGTTSGFGISMQTNRYGAMTLNIGPTGVISGQSLNPAPGITRVDYSGTLGSTTLFINVTITFTNGAQAFSVLDLTKQ